MTVRVVFDTNVLLSALGWKGRPHQCLELARNGIIEGITCQELLEELTEKLETKLGFTEEQCCETVADVLLTTDLAADGLYAGDVGTVVRIHPCITRYFASARTLTSLIHTTSLGSCVCRPM